MCLKTACAPHVWCCLHCPISNQCYTFEFTCNCIISPTVKGVCPQTSHVLRCGVLRWSQRGVFSTPARPEGCQVCGINDLWGLPKKIPESPKVRFENNLTGQRSAVKKTCLLSFLFVEQFYKAASFSSQHRTRGAADGKVVDGRVKRVKMLPHR